NGTSHGKTSIDSDSKIVTGYALRCSNTAVLAGFIMGFPLKAEKFNGRVQRSAPHSSTFESISTIST
ncbi:MAG: hypothetical protein ACO31I_13540, partial [Prochlorotrichaceae cyanobacterium]